MLGGYHATNICVLWLPTMFASGQLWEGLPEIGIKLDEPMNALFAFCGNYLFLMPIVVVVVTYLKLEPIDRRTLLLRAIVVLVFGTLLAKLGGALYNDPRPFVVHHTRPLIPHAPDNGFPSDHSLLVFGCAFLLIPFSTTATVPACVVAATVGIARVVCQLHTPLDVAASVVFAGASNLAAWLIVKDRQAVGRKIE